MRLINVDKLNEVLKVDGEYQWVAGIGTIRKVIANQPTVNAVVIPDNATNENILLSLYKDEVLVNAIRSGTRDFLMYEPASDKWVSWLDAPYKADKGAEE